MNTVDIERRIGISLPNEQFEAICYHSSFQPQDPILLKRNKEYIQWGHTIINSAYAVYLYKKGNRLCVEQLATQSNNACHCIEDAIFRKYELEDFVIKSNGEISSLHPDIVAKLIVLIYQIYGFLKVYDFLSPLFGEVEDSTGVDYKTLIQEYAQASKLSPTYEVLDIAGPDHEKRYTCKVSIGKMTAIAEAIGKKNAQKEAAKQFAIKYKVQPIGKKACKRENNQQIRVLSVQRRKEIEDAEIDLHINSRFISCQQMDEVLTHGSYVNEHRNQDIHSNACISVVGAHILSMLCAEYVFEYYDMEQTSLSKEKGVLLQEENFSKAVSEASIKYLLRSVSIENNKARSRLKTDVIKSIIGILWVNHVSEKNTAISDFTKEYAFTLFSKSSIDKILDFRTFLQEITQKYNWQYVNTCELHEHYADNSTVYLSTTTIQGANWHVFGTGVGGSKVAATNAAAKDVLKGLVSHCSDDKEIESAILRMLDPELLCIYEAKKSQVHIQKEAIKEYLPSIGTVEKEYPIVKKFDKSTAMPEEIPTEVSFDGEEHILCICKGSISCKKKEHEIVPVTGILSSLSGHPVKVNIGYCKSCKVYFINLSEYKSYQNIYGVLLGNISICGNKEYGDSGYDNLKDESILHICGYTVSQVDALSDEDRRLILGNLLDHEIVSKNRIIEDLQFFINSSMYRYNMREANRKWSDDLEWVRTYNIDKKRKYITALMND